MQPRNIMPLLWQQGSPQQCRPLDRGVPPDFMPCVCLSVRVCEHIGPVGQQVVGEAISAPLALTGLSHMVRAEQVATAQHATDTEMLFVFMTASKCCSVLVMTHVLPL